MSGRAFTPLWGSYRARFLLPGPLDLGQELDAELGAIEELPIGAFRLLAAFGISGGYTGRHFDDPGTSHAARDDLRRHARARGEDTAALADSLLDDTARFRTDLLATLRDFAATVFGQEWASVSRRLMSEVATRLQLARWRGAAQALAEIGVGTQLLPAPPRRRLGILADPERLHLSRILAHDSLPTVELARRAGSTPPQVSRQLRLLRDAGLVTAARHGRYVNYRLDLNRITSLGPELLEALLR